MLRKRISVETLDVLIPLNVKMFTEHCSVCFNFIFLSLENLMMSLARLVEWEMACSKVIVREF